MPPVQNPALQVAEIPLTKIRLNPRNPRKVIRPGQVEAKAASLKAIGLETPIKVRPLTEEEKLADPAHEYELIGGELRFRAAQSLGWPAISAYVLEAKPGDLFRKALMDNMNQEMFWLDRYEAMEELKKADTSLSNQALADMLGVVRPKVSKVIALMGVLSDSARARVRTLSTTTPDLADFLDSFETAALELGALGDPKGTATQAGERVEACLKVAIDRRMTIAQVRRLVAWAKDGNDPEAFGVASATATPKAPSHQGQRGSTPAPTSSLDQGSPTTHAEVGATIAGNILGKQIKQAPGHIANRVFPGFTRAFHILTGLFQKLGVKNLTWATFLSAFLVLWVCSFLIHQSTRLIGRALGNMFYSRYSTASTYTPPQTANPVPVSQVSHLSPGAGGQPQVGQPSAEVGATSAPESVGVASVPERALLEKAKASQNKAVSPVLVGPSNGTKAVTVMVIATQAPTKPQGEDLVGKALNNAASQGVSAATDEAVKKLLPF